MDEKTERVRKLKIILSELNSCSQNLEESCGGLASKSLYYEFKENRERLIEDIGSDIERLYHAFQELKKIN